MKAECVLFSAFCNHLFGILSMGSKHLCGFFTFARIIFNFLCNQTQSFAERINTSLLSGTCARRTAVKTENCILWDFAGGHNQRFWDQVCVFWGPGVCFWGPGVCFWGPGVCFWGPGVFVCV